ncbi:hypothetical protein EON67_08975 [archaeon]|nr:MAG: hypothetical protein EON67_08975 [archaeon]
MHCTLPAAVAVTVMVASSCCRCRPPSSHHCPHSQPCPLQAACVSVLLFACFLHVRLCASVGAYTHAHTPPLHMELTPPIIVSIVRTPAANERRGYNPVNRTAPARRLRCVQDAPHTPTAAHPSARVVVVCCHGCGCVEGFVCAAARVHVWLSVSCTVAARQRGRLARSLSHVHARHTLHAALVCPRVQYHG